MSIYYFKLIQKYSLYLTQLNVHAVTTGLHEYQDRNNKLVYIIEFDKTYTINQSHH